ncbi:MAG: hypothetical protein LBL01_05110 [Bifidobacteriaceae bacterium]|jgi:hypothetical protein|nr:hypothetical protein [Bifidobacteriaceae bacterium]
MTGQLLAGGLAWRSASRERRLTLRLAATAAVPVMALAALTSLDATASFSPAEMAATTLGRADMVVRCPGACALGQIEAAARGGDGLAPGVAAVLGEQDLAVTLTGPGGAADVPGLLLAYRDPLAAGIVRIDAGGAGVPGLALTPPLMEQLGVEVGDRVRLDPGGGELAVADAVRYAQAVDAPLAVFDPVALREAGLYEAVTGADAAGSGRLLVKAADLDAAVKRFAALGYRATTRAALSDGMESRLAPVAAWLVPLLAVAGVCAWLAAAALAARGLGRRFETLARLGVTMGGRRRVFLGQTGLAAGLGFVAGAVAGLAAGWAVKVPAQAAARQLWGPFEPDWRALVWVAAGLAATVLVGAFGLVRAPAEERLPGAARPARGALIGVLARRLAARTRLASVAGGVALTLTVVAASAALAVIEFAASALDRAAGGALPAGFASFGLERALTADEAALLEAETGGRVFGVVRAARPDGAGDYALAVLADSLTDCLKEGRSLQECGDVADQIPGGEVVIAESPSAVEALLGRELAAEEVTALTDGDGLLLADRGRWRGIGYFYVGGADAGRPEDIAGLEPLPVQGLAGYWDLPGLVLSAGAAGRLGLEPEPAETGEAHYVMSPFENAALDAAAIRAALPEGVLDINGVTVQSAAAPYAAGLRNARLAVGIGSVAVVFVAVLLLASSWAGQAAGLLGSLDRLGASRLWAARVLMRRSWPVVACAAAAGGLGSRPLAAAFLSYAYGGWTPELPVTALGLLPAASVIVIAPVTCALFAAPPQSPAARPT